MRTELSLSDEWETPEELYNHLCYRYAVFPLLDVCADEKNKKCVLYITKQTNALNRYWHDIVTLNSVDVWCNPPHSLTEQFVRYAVKQWQEFNMNILMIIPANSMCTNYAEECIEPHAEYHPINRKYCKFLKNGEEKDHARNGYFVVIWRKRNA